MAKKQKFQPGWQTVAVGTMLGFMSAVGIFALDTETPIPVEVFVEYEEPLQQYAQYAPELTEVELQEFRNGSVSGSVVKSEIGRKMSEGFSL